MDDDEFTFAVVPPPAVADHRGGLCLSGRMVGTPLYPVFGRPRSPPRAVPEPETATVRVPLGQLLLVDSDRSPAAQPPDEDLDSEPAEMYCPWSPGWSAAAAVSSPARCRKSGSTGSVLRWRPRLVGRSQSDGKEKFVFFNTSSSSSSSPSGGSAGRKHGRDNSSGSGHAWSYYAKGSGSSGGGNNNGPRRKSFLPYKQDIVGLFANAAVFRRSYHPF